MYQCRFHHNEQNDDDAFIQNLNKLAHKLLKDMLIDKELGIQKTVSAQFIGQHRDKQGTIYSVYEYIFLFEDGHQDILWQMHEVTPPLWIGDIAILTVGTSSPYYTQRPRIDITPEELWKGLK